MDKGVERAKDRMEEKKKKKRRRREKSAATGDQ